MHNGVRADDALRREIETFLYDEAALLDDWELDRWLELFTEDARYVVPTTDLPEGDPRTDLVFIDDDVLRLTGRVRRLKSRHAHREYPWSRTRRFIANVRILASDGDQVDVEASFIVYRFRSGDAVNFVGRYRYVLVRTGDGLRIRYRRANLDFEDLRSQGAVSVIV